MTKAEKAQTLDWMRNWSELGPLLEKLRREKVRRADTASAIESFDLAYKSARLHCPSRKTTGLVEQQRWFKRGHE
jgi:hypothetical protein